MRIGIEGLTNFSDEDPILYHNVAAAFYEMGLKHESLEVLKKGIEIFADDKELKKFLNDVEDDFDDPQGGEFFGLILLTALMHKQLRRKL